MYVYKSSRRNWENRVEIGFDGVHHKRAHVFRTRGKCNIDDRYGYFDMYRI